MTDASACPCLLVAAASVLPLVRAVVLHGRACSLLASAALMQQQAVAVAVAVAAQLRCSSCCSTHTGCARWAIACLQQRCTCVARGDACWCAAVACLCNTVLCVFACVGRRCIWLCHQLLVAPAATASESCMRPPCSVGWRLRSCGGRHGAVGGVAARTAKQLLLRLILLWWRARYFLCASHCWWHW